MNWECILEFCISSVLSLAAIFLAYRTGYNSGRHKGYLEAIDDMEEMVTEMQKETKEG